MHEAAFARAVLPKPAVVLGVLMRPFSLGHELLLLREENRLSLHSTDRIRATRSDLFKAALICCHTWTENVKSDVFLGWKLKLWGLRVRGMDAEAELEKFVRYQVEGSREFRQSEIWNTSRPAPTRRLGSPLLVRLHQFLTERGMSEVQAWDYPFGRAKMEWQASLEAEGAFDVYNADEAAFDEYVAAEEAKEGACRA